MRNLSPAAMRSINAQMTDGVWLCCCTLSHTDWLETVRLVANTENITHNGNVFSAAPLSVTLPDEGDDAIGLMDFTLGFVNQDLIAQIRSIQGAIYAEVFWVLASSPDVLEVYFEAEIRALEFGSTTITGQLAAEPLLDSVFGSEAMDSTNCPGLI